MAHQSTRLRHRLLRESFKEYAIYGTVWSLDTLWEYFYGIDKLIRHLKGKDREEQERILKSDQQVGLYKGFSTPDEQGADISHVDPEKYISPQMLRSVLALLKNEKGFPDIKKLFGFKDILELANDEGKRQSVAQKAYDVVKKITAYRTDLNYVPDEERMVIEMVGYTLCSLEYHCNCSDILKKKTLIEEVPFSKKYDSVFDPEEILQSLKYTDSLWGTYVTNNLLRIPKMISDTLKQFTKALS